MLTDRPASALLFSLLGVISFAVAACSDGAKAHDADAGAAGLSGSIPISSGAGRGGNGGRAAGGASGGGEGNAFWTQSTQISTNGNDPKRFFLMGDGGWIVRVGIPALGEHHWSFDQGATWTRFHTPWRGPVFADSTFWLLGIGLDGTPIARWSYPLDCNECAAAGAPGMPGDTLLIRYDRATNAWQPIDVLPPAAKDVQNIGRTATPSPTELWLFGSTSLFRWSGPGTATQVSLPDDHVVVDDVAGKPGGGAFLVSQGELFAWPSSGTAWQPMTLPPSMPVTTAATARKVHVDRAGQLYVVGFDFDGHSIYRADAAGVWTTISPERPAAPANNTPSDWLLGAGRTGALLAVTASYPSQSGMKPTLTVRSSTNHGATWLDRTAGLPNSVPQDIVFDADGRAYFCARDGGTFVWTSPTPLP